MSTSVASVVSFFPSAQNGFSTTLSAGIASGATTVPLTSVSGYTNGDVAVMIVDPTSATAKQTFTGIVDTAGVRLTSVVWTAGTNQTHSIGATVVDYETATHFSMISKGILVQHAQDGSHKNITSTAITNTGAFNQTGATTLAGSWDGWVGANESWAYASATTITVPTDATTKYDVGDYIKITQSATVKYFVIMSLTSTVLTVAGFSGVTVANTAITSPAYSKVRNPHGAAVEYLSNLPFLQTQANAGSAGGTINYMNLGGIKMAWGITAALSGITASFTVTLPASFFTTVDSATVTANPNSNVDTIANINGLTTGAMSFYIFRGDAPASTANTNANYWMVIGT